jgi:drug/metabolite transporter (DMT)-like permease
MFSAFYGELIAISTTLSWTLCVFPFTEASRRLGPNATNLLRLILAVLLLSVAAIFTSSMTFVDLFTTPNLENWLWLGLSGILGLALGDFLGFTMYAILGTRIGSIFTTMSPGVALFLGFFLLNETINYIGIIGIFITVGGIIWLTLSKNEKAKIPDLGHGKIEKGILFGILAALCQGVGLVFAKKGLSSPVDGHTLNAIHATWIRMIAATIAIFVNTIIRGQSKNLFEIIKENKQNGVFFVVLGTIFGPVVGVSLSLYAISLIEVGVAQTIFSLVPVFVLPLAYLFYKEKITLKALLGVLIAVSGVILLIWRDYLQSLIS